MPTARSSSGRSRLRRGFVAVALIAVLVLILAACGAGTPDSSFGSGGVATLAAGKPGAWESVFVQSDGKILAAGELQSAGSPYPGGAVVLARYNANGTPDGGFGTNGVTFVGPEDGVSHVSSVIAVDPYIFVTYVNGANFSEYERFSNTGGLEVTSTQYPVGLLGTQVYAAVPAPNGTFTTAGTYRDASGHTFAELQRFTTLGNLDPTFGIGGVVRFPFASGSTDSRLVDLAGRADGEAYVAGTASTTGGPVGYLAAVGTTGAADFNFGPFGVQPAMASGSPASPVAIALFPDGHLAVGSSGASGNKITRYNSDGTTDQSWTTSGDTATLTAPNLFGMNDMTVDPAGRVLVTTVQANGMTLQPYVTRLTTAGAVDTGFGTNGAYLGAAGDHFGTIGADASNRVLLGGIRGSSLLLERLSG
jgi:uncharacterized delta-60 repeat protein